MERRRDRASVNGQKKRTNGRIEIIKSRVQPMKL
jgi:hypothetical protein